MNKFGNRPIIFAAISQLTRCKNGHYEKALKPLSKALDTVAFRTSHKKPCACSAVSLACVARAVDAYALKHDIIQSKDVVWSQAREGPCSYADGGKFESRIPIH